MIRKIASLLLAASFALLVQFADCLTVSADQQTMQCCGTMPCNPANHSHDCCKKMVSSQGPSALPGVQHTVSSPPAVATALVSIVQVNLNIEIFRSTVDAPQHSPPDLYILYASFLI